MHPLKKNLKRLLLGVVLLGITLLALFSFLPKKYDVVAFAERPGTAYLSLEDGSKIGYFRIVNTADTIGSPVIYLHGGPGGIIKDEVIQSLSPLASQGHDLYFYDQIGSGHSDRLDDISGYSVERHRQDLSKIVELTGAEQVILIGHSWGSMLAVNYLQDHPEKVEKLILEGPGPILPVDRNLANASPPDSLQLRAPEYSNRQGNQAVYTWRSRLVDKWAQLFGRKLASDREADDFFTLLNSELNKSTHCTIEEAGLYPGGAGYYAHIMTLRSFAEVENKREALKSLELPVLVIKGQCDNQKWGYTEEYLSLFQNARLEVLEDTGHSLTGSEQYFPLLRGFLMP